MQSKDLLATEAEEKELLDEETRRPSSEISSIEKLLQIHMKPFKRSLHGQGLTITRLEERKKAKRSAVSGSSSSERPRKNERPCQEAMEESRQEAREKPRQEVEGRPRQEVAGKSHQENEKRSRDKGDARLEERR